MWEYYQVLYGHSCATVPRMGQSWCSICSTWQDHHPSLRVGDMSCILASPAEDMFLALYILWDLTRHRDRDISLLLPNVILPPQPVWAIKNWLRIYRLLVMHSIKEAAGQAVQNVWTITSYFPQREVPD
jgi:hypothetical protein